MEQQVSVPGPSTVPSGVEAYVPSGMVGPAWPLALVAGIAGAALLGTIYALLAVFNPCIGVLNVFLAIGAGLLAGKCVVLGVRLGHIRSPKMAVTLGAVTGLFLIVFAWLGFVSLLLGRTGGVSALAVWIGSIRDPSGMFSFIFGPLLENGWFNVRGYVPTGIVLLVSWLVEAGCLMFGCVGTAWVAARSPFNERMGRWYDSELHPGWFVVPGRDAKDQGPLVVTDLERLALGGAADGRLQVRVHFIRGQREDMLVSVESVIEVPEDAEKAAKAAAGKGDPKKVKMKVNREEVLAPHFVPAAWIDRLDALFAQSLTNALDASSGDLKGVEFRPPWA